MDIALDVVTLYQADRTCVSVSPPPRWGYAVRSGSPRQRNGADPTGRQQHGPHQMTVGRVDATSDGHDDNEDQEHDDASSHAAT